MTVSHATARLILDPEDFADITEQFLHGYSQFLLPEGTKNEDGTTPADLVIATLYPVHGEPIADPMLWLQRLLALGDGPIFGNPVPGTAYEFYANAYEAFQGFVQEHLISHVEELLGLSEVYVDLSALHDAGVNITRVIEDLAIAFLPQQPHAVRLANSLFCEPPFERYEMAGAPDLSDAQITALMRRR